MFFSLDIILNIYIKTILINKKSKNKNYEQKTRNLYDFA